MTATSSRRRSRERAVQALFSLETATPEELSGLLARFWETVEEETDDEVRGFAETIVRGVIAHRDALDETIQSESANWKVERMARVDRNILRVGAWELVHSDTPGRVVINEAVEVAKTYGSEGSAAFVNGILDKVARGAGRL